MNEQIYKRDTVGVPPPKPVPAKVQSDLVVNIMAHGDATETLKRHMPFFKSALGDGEFILWSPQDNPIHWPGMSYQHMGFKGHDGSEPLRRMKYMLQFLADGPWERIAILEYDCLLIAGWPEFPAPALAGIFYMENNHETFHGRQFPHPPLFMRRMTCQALTQAFNRIPLNSEGGMWDRAIGFAMDLASIPLFDLHEGGKGYSQNTIRPHHFESVRKAAQDGACYWHGVKDSETLQVILQAKK